jgi:uncharacterized membrane protein
MKNKQLLYLTEASMIAALYVCLTYLAQLLGLASGVIQFRISEALCILPVFTPAAIPGLFVGCLLSNVLTGCLPWDILFGSLATLIGASAAYLIRRHPMLAPLPNIASNTVIVPFVLRYVYGAPDSLPFLFLTVGIGEIVCGGALGILLYLLLKKHQNRLFRHY